MKNRMVLRLALAAIVFAGCVEEKEDKSLTSGGIADVAYISLKVKTEKNEARSSGENAGMNESDLKTLYLIMRRQNRMRSRFRQLQKNYW